MIYSIPFVYIEIAKTVQDKFKKLIMDKVNEVSPLISVRKTKVSHGLARNLLEFIEIEINLMNRQFL